MNPAKVNRDQVRQLTDLPNIGKSLAQDLQQLGVTEPAQLAAMSAHDMYQQLCAQTGTRQDPCVLDVFISVTRFMQGEPPRPWWDYTEERKRLWPDL